MSAGGTVILLYHRVSEPASDPFELAVTPGQFADHLALLGTLGSIERLSDAAERIASGSPAGVSFVITFDDGYADNLHAAKPVLHSYGAPATVFIATDWIGGRQFWWDELAELVLEAESLPAQVSLDAGGVAGRWESGDLGRERLYREIWAQLQPLDDAPRAAALAAIRSQLAPAAGENGRSLTREELRDLTRDGLVEIGAHTQTHPVLSTLTDDRAREEITGSKEWLEDALERSVPAFSYPFGGSEHYGQRDVEIVRSAGFELACSAEAGVARPGSDPFQLARVTVGKWDVDKLEQTVRGLLANGAGR